MKHVGLLGGLRSYIGVEGGMYRNVSAEQLAAHVLRQIPLHVGIPVEDVDMVIAGNGTGGGGNITRLALLEADYPVKVAGITVDVQCGSGLEAISMAAARIEAGLANVIIAGGMESASTKPTRFWNENHPDYSTEHPAYHVAKFAPGSPDELAMFKGAERVAQKLSVEKKTLNQYVIKSHQKAVNAREKKCLRGILAQPYTGQKKTMEGGKRRKYDSDEGIRSNMSEKLLNRLPALVPGGVYTTAGTVSLTNDGAAFVVLCSKEYARKHGLYIYAWIRDVVSIGDDPDYSPESVIVAIRSLLERNHLRPEQITAWECNEAFAVIDELMKRYIGIEETRYNIFGGALAYGHPYGVSGAMITLHLLEALKCLPVADETLVDDAKRSNGKYGVAAIAAAGGIGTAILLEQDCDCVLWNKQTDRKQEHFLDMLRAQPKNRTMLVEDDRCVTYGQMCQQIDEKRKQLCIVKGEEREICFIQEPSIMEELVLFFACQGTRYVPVVLSMDVTAREKEQIRNTVVPDDAVMGVMTSGTSGDKKILFRTFESWANFFEVQNDIFSVEESTVLFMEGSIAFSGNMNLYMALFSVGGTAVATTKFYPDHWMKLISKYPVNAIYLIPAKMMALCRVVKKPIDKVVHGIAGSQSFGRQERTTVKKSFPNLHIVLYYGSSEASYITYVPEEEMTEDTSLVGIPFPGVKVQIQDGVFYVTTECAVIGADMPCRTGDLGRVDEEGKFYFLGREDDILNINGRKVSAYRIEQEIKDYYGVEGVAKVKNTGNRQQLVFEYEGKEKLPAATMVRKQLQGRLMEYEIPKSFRQVEQLNRTDSGKIRRV